MFVRNRRFLTGVILGVLLGSATGQIARPNAPRAIRYLGHAGSIRLAGQELQTFTVKQNAPLTEEETVKVVRQLMSYTGTDLSRNRDENDKEESRIFFRSERDASAKLVIDPRTGNLLFNRGMAGYKEEKDTPDLPQLGEAQKAALGHLKSLAMIPPEEELVLIHVGGLNMGVHRDDGATSLYRKLVTVRYGRKLGGLPVIGRSRIVIQVAERGELVGLVRRWSEVQGQKISREQLRSAAEIKASLEKRLRAESGQATGILVRRTDLVMYDHGNGVIEPAIHVIASLLFEVKVVNGRIVGETRRLDVPYDSLEPVLKAYRSRYPFMHDTRAGQVIKSDQPTHVGTERQQSPPEDDSQ
jgi:hypothetical protein